MSARTLALAGLKPAEQSAIDDETKSASPASFIAVEIDGEPICLALFGESVSRAAKDGYFQ
jgi:hypothetical protein